MKFGKPAVSINDQIELLKHRGVVVADEAYARHHLQFISYYRLKAYWSPFRVNAEVDEDQAFPEGASFNDVLTLYTYDRELRLLVLDAIECVEVALRAQWAYHMAMNYGPHGYLEQRHYAHIARHARAVADLTKEFGRSRDIFAVRYREKYTSPKLPPAWMAGETMSFGLLSKLYGDLKFRSERQAIASPFGLDEKVFASFIHHISHVRNVCAHHGRLWNRRFTLKMTVPKFPRKLHEAMRGADQRYLHNTLVMLDYLQEIIAPEKAWKKRVVALLEDYPCVDPSSMGFPVCWRRRTAWKMAS